MMQLLIVGLMY